MKRTLQISFLAALPLFFAACTAEQPADQPAPAKDPAPKAEASAVADRVVAEATEFDVKCGCSIDGVGHCGNYVQIEGQYIPIMHGSLGRMEWCAKKDAGAKVSASGEIKGGKFLAVALETLK